MSLEIKVGPPQLAIHQGHVVLLSEPDGQINWPSEKGLYFYDTRVVSSWTVYANGEPWDLLNGGATTCLTARIFLTNRDIVTEEGPIAQHTLGLVLSRHIDGGVHEDIDLTNYARTNYARTKVRFNLEIALRSDFADIFEVKSKHFVRRGHITTEWSEDKQCLTTSYRNQDFFREVAVTARNNDCPAVYANGRISFEVELAPAASWHSCLAYDLSDRDQRYPAPGECTRSGDELEDSQRLADWQRDVLKADSSNDAFRRLFRQATDDMAALRLPIPGADRMQPVPAAGLPWFVALFGRDSLIVSLQSALVCSGFARGTLDVLGSLQATQRDDYRDAEPGKIMHELRLGELAKLKLVPHTPYYGSADATPLYLITLHAAWCCTGDRDLLKRHLPTAERCLDWIDSYGDRDGTAFRNTLHARPPDLRTRAGKIPATPWSTLTARW
jgi:glycogen debranching enzyme